MNSIINRIYTVLNAVLISTIIFVGCDVMNTGTDGPPEVQVQMKIETPGTVAKQSITSPADSSSISIDEVKLFIEEMELDGTDGTRDFEIEYFIVNLPLDGSPLKITEKEIPAGFYDEFELEIEKPDDDDHSVSDPDFRDDTGNYSVVVRGSFDGEDFTFRSAEDFEIEMDLNPPLEIEESGNSVLLVEVDISSWFKGLHGDDPDPNAPSNIDRINENIEKSFDGFEDSFDDEDDDFDDDDDDDDDDDFDNDDDDDDN